MDDKELIKKIKNSFSSGMPRSEITRRLQSKGYKLEYIDSLIDKVRSKKFLIVLAIILILALIASILAYTFLFSQNIKNNMPNPLSVTGNAIAHESGNYSDTEITIDFISYLLNEIGVYKLHKNILTGEKAIINLKIGEQNFTSLIDKKIETKYGSHENPDIIIFSSSQEILNALSSQSSSEYFKQSLQQGKTSISIIASQPKLFSKGYLSVYNSLKV